MSTHNDRIYNLAGHAWALSNSDPVRAIEILRAWTGLSFDLAFAAIDEAMPLECDAIAQPLKDFEP